MDHDLSPDEETPGEMYLNDTLPVAPERQRLLMTLMVPKLRDQSDPYKEKDNERTARGKKKEKLVVKEHCLDTTTKKWSEWTSCSKGKKTPKQHSEQNMLECTLELLELFTPDHTTKHAVNAK